MQTFLVDADYKTSASLLDSKRLFSQIYEGIHILASLTLMNNRLVNPKRNISNHPIVEVWRGHEWSLFNYVSAHYSVWSALHPLTINTINQANIELLSFYKTGSVVCPILDRIPYYKKLLKEKDPVFYNGGKYSEW